MCSRSHISKASVHILHALVLLHILAEWAMSLLDISELVLVLQEALAAVSAHCHRHVRDHVLVELPWQIRAKSGVVNDIDFLIPHVLKDSLVDLYRLVAVWVDLGL